MSNYLNFLPCVCLLIAAPAFADSHLLELDPNNFDETSHVITNPWWPLKPGEQLVYEGTAVEEGETIEHRFVDTVTDLTKVVGGIRALVSLEEDFQDGNLVEQEIAFHAQDKDGNVWHLGQLREVYDEVELVGGRVWVVDHPEGSKAGIRMEADPKLGNPEYSQGFSPAPFNWTDSAKVSAMGAEVVVPVGQFSDVMIIDEHDLETEPGVFQTKYYAKDLGLIQIGYKGNDPQQEELFLTSVKMLSADELGAARDLALEIDGRAYLYNVTTPAEQIAQ